jgi:hypothetical protein
LEELYEEAIEMIVDVLEDFSEEEQLNIGNAYREMQNYSELHTNDDTTINEELEGTDPWELLQLGEDWDSSDGYFTWDGYDLHTTDDIWEDADPEDIARAILEGDMNAKCRELIWALDEYDEAKEEIENYNPYRAMCEEVVAKYVNCEADVTDLLQTLDKLAKSDDAWEEN